MNAMLFFPSLLPILVVATSLNIALVAGMVIIVTAVAHVPNEDSSAGAT